MEEGIPVDVRVNPCLTFEILIILCTG